MGIIRVFLPHTLSKWHEHGFDPKHVQAHDLRVVDHPKFFFFCVCVPPFLGLASKWHEAIWHVWSLMTKSCVQAPLLQIGETKKHKKHCGLCCLQQKSKWDEFSTLSWGIFLKKSMTISPSLNICTCAYTSSPASPMHNHQQELDTNAYKGYSHHARMVQPWTEENGASSYIFPIQPQRGQWLRLT